MSDLIELKLEFNYNTQIALTVFISYLPILLKVVLLKTHKNIFK